MSEFKIGDKVKLKKLEERVIIRKSDYAKPFIDGFYDGREFVISDLLNIPIMVRDVLLSLDGETVQYVPAHWLELVEDKIVPNECTGVTELPAGVSLAYLYDGTYYNSREELDKVLRGVKLEELMDSTFTTCKEDLIRLRDHLNYLIPLTE